MKNLFKKSNKKNALVELTTLDHSQLKNIVGGSEEATGKVTFKSKEGATANATVTDSGSIQDEGKSFTSIIR
jgi:hypothetical protein